MAEEKYTERVIGKTKGNVPVVATKELDDVIQGGGGGGGVTPTSLLAVLRGTDFISVDESEDEEHVDVKIDEAYAPHIVELEFTAPSTTEGDISEEDFEKLTYSHQAKILLDDEYYNLADEQETFDVYTHVGRDATNKVFIKTLYIYTDETSELYRHFILSKLEVGSPTGNFVKVINASDIDVSNLTDNQIQLFAEGIFVNGTLLNQKNPVFFPYGDHTEGFKRGIFMSKTKIGVYQINLTAKSLSENGQGLVLLDTSGSSFDILSPKLRGKSVPTIPADASEKNYLLKLVNGQFQWIEETA